MKTNYLSNAFSLQMLKSTNAIIEINEVSSFPDNCISAIGHQDTANLLNVTMNRISISLDESDFLYVAQLMGGRLSEGTTKLPDGFNFKIMEISIKYT